MSNASNIATWPSFTQEESDVAARVLLSNRVNYWTGNEGRSFEKEFAKFTQTRHAIAVANGTVALDLAFNGLRIGEINGGSSSDEVIVTPRSFMASVSAIVNAGARPVFADVGLDSQNIEPETVEKVITKNTRAILCVHLAGWPCDMQGMRSLIADRDIKLIEDCAQAHGARYQNLPVGGLGDIGTWSFCQDKIMTTAGEGGMVTCNDEDLWKRMWAYKDHGKSWDATYNREHPTGFRWLHESFGTNWRLTEIQSAIGRLQLKKLEGWNKRRTKNAQLYAQALSASEKGRELFRIPNTPQLFETAQGTRHAWYKFYAFIKPHALPPGWSRNRIVKELTDRGVPCMQGSCSEIYLEKAFEGTGLCPASRLRNAKELGDTSLMFQVHPSLTKDNLLQIQATISETIGLIIN